MLSIWFLMMIKLEFMTEKGLENVFIRYFPSLFTSSNPTVIYLVIESCCSKISSEYKDFLDVIFTEEEVHVALKEMGSKKSSGPDGVFVGFYQKNWEVVGSDVVKGVFDVLNTGASVSKINHINIILVLNKKGACFTNDFRPISLCNVLYKLIAKVLANRLQIVLDSVISEQQNAFIPNKQIYDNVIVA